jgi:hypothetical protein
MAGTTGYRDTNTVESTILQRDIRKAILRYEPNLTPLLVITSNIGLGSQVTVNPKFEWYEEGREVRRDTSTTAGTGPTTLAVTDGTLWHKDEVWKNTRTNEGFRVSSVSTNNVTVVPNLAGAGSVATVSGDEYIKVGVSKMEGDTELPAFGANPTQKFNYTQIFERTWAMTRTAKNTANYTNPNDWDERKRRAMDEFKIDKESAYLWSPGPARDTSGTHPRTLTRGIRDSITTNVKDFGGTVTEAEFWDGFDSAFRYSNPRNAKVAISGRTPISVINGFPRGKLELVQGDNDSTYGLKVMRYQHAFGTLNFVVSNLFSNSTSLYANEVLILDMDGSGGDTLVQERYLANSEMIVDENVQENGRDGQMGKVLCESGIMLGLEKNHSLWKNMGA